jgi:16S rRNA (uracil1498-N3)-methyltransferase
LRQRFFVEQFDARAAVVRGESAHHLSRVLRAEPGQLYELSDGKAVWLGRIVRSGRDAVEFKLLEPLAAREPSLRIRLLLSIIKFDRFEWSLEKATELGASEIVPLASARSEKALVAAAAKRAQRWGKILIESAQQARLLRPPTLETAAKPEASFARAQAGLKILFSERPDAPALRQLLEGSVASSVAVAIGPEGGWTDQEIQAARAADFREASLGGNILRMETAVIAGLAILDYSLGDSRSLPSIARV